MLSFYVCMSKASGKLEDKRGGKPEARPALHPRSRRGSNAGGKSRWMRGFFSRSSPPLWQSIKPLNESLDTIQQ
jgi:hypothetical protein